MGTWHADGLEVAAYQALGDQPHAGTAMHMTWKAIHEDNALGSFLVPIVGQIDRRAGWSIGQVYAAALTLDGIMAGRILMRRLYVGEGPHADKMREENAAALAKLPEPWRVWVDETQYGADSDGWLKWDQPRMFLQNETPEHAFGAWCAIDEGCAPLEIGTTNASRSWMHLVQSGSLARWPYDDDCVTVLTMTDEQPERTWPIPEGKSACEALLDLGASGLRLTPAEPAH